MGEEGGGRSEKWGGGVRSGEGGVQYRLYLSEALGVT